MNLSSSLRLGAAVGVPRSCTCPSWSECTAVMKSPASRKSSLINPIFGLMAPLPFLFNPYPALPHFFPHFQFRGPLTPLPAPLCCCFFLQHHLLLGPSCLPLSTLHACFSHATCCFLSPSPPPFYPEPLKLCHRIGKAGLVASPAAASLKSHHTESPAVLSHFALPWSGFAQMNPGAQLGGPGHRGLECHLPAQPPPGNKLLSCPNDKNKRSDGARARTGRPGGTKRHFPPACSPAPVSWAN